MVLRLRSVASRGLTLAVVMALSGAAAADYHGSGEPPRPEAEASEAVATEPADTEPSSALDEFIEFVKAGRVEIFLRPRWENAKQDAQKTSNAMTLRTALGYGTKPWHGFSVFAEFENIASPNNGLYYDGIGTNGSNRTQISDPTETELNQAYGEFALTTLGSYDLTAAKARRV